MGRFVPGGSALIAWAVAPFAAVSARHRLGVVLAAGGAGAAVGLLAGGTGTAASALACATLGAIVGAALRRGWSLGRTLLVAALVLWPAASAVIVGAASILTASRKLALAQVRNSWRGLAHMLTHLRLGVLARAGDSVVGWLIGHWWLAAIALLLCIIEVAVAVAWLIARPVVRAIAHAVPPRGTDYAVDPRPPGPIPAHIHDVTVRYPGVERPALDRLTVDVPDGKLVTVVGPNGSGKSTFGRVLAGATPTCGRVERAGAAGLGRPGGTAIIFQRPESQVLGLRAGDDVRWGAPECSEADVDALLERVGLAGFAHRDTSTLSGGELQRLAVAAALARSPRLIVSDESTAMVDQDGRRALIGLYRGLAGGATTVVHITHDPNEADHGDVVIALDAGRLASVATPSPSRASARSIGVTAAAGDAAVPRRGTRSPAGAAIDLVGVEHVYDDGTPWSHRALHRTDLRIDAGETVVVEGPNGSGKSTLAWIIAGLTVPSRGTASVGGTWASEGRRVGMSFQHARLQLQRTFVREEIRDAAGVSDADADDALAAVGLDPFTFAGRRVDALSGGEQRRVAIAGLLAAHRDVVVLDEPYAGLDTAARDALTNVLRALRADGVTIVIVTHDHESSDAIADRRIRIEDGRIVADTAPRAPRAHVAAGEPPRHRAPGLHLFRVLPERGLLHRVNAATKLVTLVALGVILAISPQWRTIAAAAGFVAAGMIVGRIPFSARPRLPHWFVVALLLSGAINVIAGGAPNVHLLGSTFGMGAVLDWLRATSIAVVLLGAALLVSWTTSFAEVPAALATLTRPFRLLRLPVDNWLATCTIALRSMPPMLDEVRTLLAARRLRAPAPPHADHRRRRLLEVAVHLLIAVMVVALRRAGECADALQARGM